MLKDKARYYYKDLGKHCSDGILLAANEVYGLGLNGNEMELFAGFATGMGCGSTCGALIGAVAVISKLFRDRDDVKELAAGFVAAFEKKMSTISCETLAAQYKTEANRCTDVVEMTAELLESYIGELNGERAPAEDTCTLSAADIKRVKGLGFLQHKGTNKFNGRVITRNGRITVEEAKAIQEAAERYGDGHMMFTTRLTVEVSGIDYHDIDAFREYIGKVGLLTGGTGSKVRPVVSCKGTTCQYGLYDTYELSDEIHNRFYLGYREVALPHKFKIALGGCPNNCVKPNLNDLGIIGARVPQFDEDTCRGCGKCQVEQACPVHAAKVVDGKLVIDPKLCNNCGRCVTRCPFHCNDESTYGWRVYIGGRWGKKIAHGRMISKVFTDKNELFDVVEKSILLFRSEGIPGERFADTIERIGFDKAEAMILGKELLEKKAEILGSQVTGGATC